MTEIVAYISSGILLIFAFIGISAWGHIERRIILYKKAPSSEETATARRRILVASVMSGISIGIIGATASWPLNLGSISSEQLFGGVIFMLFCAIGFPAIIMIAFTIKIKALQNTYEK